MIDAAVINAADAAEMRTTTGGVGTVTLSEINGSPKLRDKWASGVHVVPYTIRATNGMREWGLGNYNADTDQLERPDTVLSWAPGVGYATTKVSLPTSDVTVGFSLTVAAFNQVQTNLQALQADIVDHAAELAGKADDVHTHTIAQVTGLQAVLDTLIAGEGGELSDADRGDITTSEGGAAFTINDDAVTSAKLGGDITTAGKAILTAADAAAQRAALALGSAALAASSAFAAAAHSHAATDLTSGTIPTARLPELTGDVTRAAGTAALAIPLASIGTSKLGGDVTTAGKALLTGADASAQRTTLGLGSAATASSSSFAASGHAHAAADISSGTLAAARMPALTGDVTTSAGAVATTLANDAVTNAKLRNSAALSVIGNATNATADPADIAAGTDGHVLRRSGTAIGFGVVSSVGLGGDITTVGKALLTAVDEAAQRTALGFEDGAGDVSQDAFFVGDDVGAGYPVITEKTPAQVKALLDLPVETDDAGFIVTHPAPTAGASYSFRAPVPGVFTTLLHETVSGTCTDAVAINGTAVTGFGGAVTSTLDTDTATAARTFAKGDKITVSWSAASSAVNYSGTLNFDRI